MEQLDALPKKIEIKKTVSTEREREKKLGNNFNSIRTGAEEGSNSRK